MTLEDEAAPPFLFQELLQSLLEIDKISMDTAGVQLPDGQISYVAYFFTRFSEENRQGFYGGSQPELGRRRRNRCGI